MRILIIPYSQPQPAITLGNPDSKGFPYKVRDFLL